MDNKELEQLIGEMPIGENEKNALITDVSSGMAAQEILAKINGVLTEKVDELDRANPEAAAEHKAADDEYAQAVSAAAAEFDASMAQINKEAEEVGQEVLQRLDDARAQEIKESI